MTIIEFLKSLFYPVILLITTVTKMLWKEYPDDNPAEEVAEYIIEQQTGIDIDLTPYSPEEGEKKEE